MRSTNFKRNTDRQIIEQLIGFFINLTAFGRVGLSNAAVQDIAELVFDIIRQTKAASIGAQGIGLVPVVWVMDVFQPASGQNWELGSALCAQVGSPGQTQGFKAEEFIDSGQVASEDFSNGLTGGIPLVVGHLDTETGRPNITFGIVTSRNAIFICISEFELRCALIQISSVVRGILEITRHTWKRQANRLD